jgi:glyine---[glycyl-carrier protein] ligase
VRTTNLEAYANQEMPFERLVEELHPAQRLAVHPLFQVALVLRNTPMVRFELPGLTVSGAPLANTAAKFDLTFILGERHTSAGVPSGIEGSIEYALDLFQRETVEEISAQYVRILERVLIDG